MKNEILELLGEIMREQGVEERLIPKVNNALCQRAGGDRYYVPSLPKEAKKNFLGEAVRNHVPIKQAAAQIGITERHALRILATKWTIKTY